MKIHTSFKMIPGTGFHQSKPWAIVLLILIFVGLSVMPVAASDPALTQIGQFGTSGSISAVDVTVQVKNESGSTVSGAKVYHEGSYIGLTDASGNLTAHNVVLGDMLAAMSLVYTAPAGKPYHSMDGNISWGWRVYQTSVNIPDNGTPELFEVTDTTAVQVLTVRKDQALIGIHIVAVVQWDASSTFLDDIEQGLKSASAFLYDVTDGQFIYEMIEIYDNTEMGAANDYIMYTDNTVWPNAYIGAISQTTGRMYFPPLFGSSWSSRGTYGVLIHEFGHYGLWLDDEYKDRNGSSGGYCTLNRDTSNDETTRASIMDCESNASELCSDADPNHLHNTNTLQDATNNGETTWETVMRVYTDKGIPSRWTLQSPNTRNIAVVSGPTSIPVADWMKVYMDDNDTNVCDPFTALVTYSDNKPAAGAEVTAYSTLGYLFSQGKTSASGQVTVWGAHNGDLLSAKKDYDKGSIIISCTPTAAGVHTPVAIPTVILMPDPNKIWLKYEPLIMGKDTVEIQVKSNLVLPVAPQVLFWQEGAAEPINVVLAYDRGLDMYIGQVTLNSELDLKGNARVVAPDGQGHAIDNSAPFVLQSINMDGNTWLKSFDGRMEIFLREGSLPGSPTVIIQPASQVNPHQGFLTVVSEAYEVSTSSAEKILQVPATLNIYFPMGQNILLQNEQLGLYRWDALNGIWILISGNVDWVNRFVSAQIDQLGIYAIMAQPIFTIQLPLISR